MHYLPSHSTETKGQGHSTRLKGRKFKMYRIKHLSTQQMISNGMHCHKIAEVKNRTEFTKDLNIYMNNEDAEPHHIAFSFVLKLLEEICILLC